MDLDKDYVEYVLEFSLALLAVSAAYFFDPYRPVTYTFLLLVPLLFGYTTYISRDGFSRSSLLAVITLVFIPLNYLIAGVAVFIALGNVLVSAFSGGSRFKEFYSSTTIPLLLTGLVLGSGLFLLATANPEFGDRLRNSTSEYVGSQAGNLVENSELVDSSRKAQKTLVAQTSRVTVIETRRYVFQNTSLSRNNSEVVEAFRGARRDIPRRLSRRTGEQVNTGDLELENRISDFIRNNLQGNAVLLFIPAVTMGLYGLQPVIGLLTAIMAVLIKRYGEELHPSS